MEAYWRNQEVTYLTTLSHVSAIIQVGNSIVSALSSEQGPSGDGLKKTLQSLRSRLMPDSAWEEEAKSKRMREILEKEVSKGAFEVQPIGISRKKKKLRPKEG